MSGQDEGPSPRIAVYGAAGHTGRFVCAELARRGLTPVAIVRDPTKAQALRWPETTEVRCAELEPAALEAALAGCAAVINCAGPFLDTADAVATAALNQGLHYLDVTAEQTSAAATLARFDAKAGKVGALVLPAMAFYGGLADLLATAAAGEWREVDEIAIGIALDSWRPTQGTRLTGARNTAPRLIVSGGRLIPAPQPPAEREWTFEAPFGPQPVVAVPFSEMVLVHRHLHAAEVRTWLNSTPLADLRNPDTPPPEPSDDRGRSDQTFLVEVRVTKDGQVRRATARGRDIYGVTAPFVVEGVVRILRGQIRARGARAPGEAFDARDYLKALSPDVRCVFTAGSAP